MEAAGLTYDGWSVAAFTDSGEQLSSWGPVRGHVQFLDMSQSRGRYATHLGFWRGSAFRGYVRLDLPAGGPGAWFLELQLPERMNMGEGWISGRLNVA